MLHPPKRFQAMWRNLLKITTTNADKTVEPQPTIDVRTIDTDLNYLHIGKTGGSGMRDMITELAHSDSPVKIRYRGHNQNIRKIVRQDPDARIIYFVREPIERFISGFNSRYRHGYPRYKKQYLEGEKIAFQRFHTPDQLGVALADEDPAADHAWQSILHVRLSFTHYLNGVDVLKRRAKNIVYIGQTETYDDDIVRLKAVLGIPDVFHTPKDEVRAFRAPDGVTGADFVAARV